MSSIVSVCPMPLQCSPKWMPLVPQISKWLVLISPSLGVVTEMVMLVCLSTALLHPPLPRWILGHTWPLQALPWSLGLCFHPSCWEWRAGAEELPWPVTRESHP